MKRRNVLAGLGAIGVGAGLGGVGTSALYSDQETTQTTITAGDLDIQIDWRAFHNDVQFSSGGPQDVDGLMVAEFIDVKPCDNGCIQFSIHNDTNPAYIHTAFEIVNDNDNYLTEPEMDAEEGGFSTQPEDGTHDDGCFFAGKVEGWNGTEFTVVENGQPTNQENEYIFMVESPDKNHEEVRVKLRPKTVNSEGELIEYSLESLTSGCGICAVDTKSGQAEETHGFDGCVSGETATVTTPGTNNQGDLQGISNIEVFVCNTAGDPGEPQTDDDGELDECILTRFFEDPDEDCEPDEGETIFFGSDPFDDTETLRSLINNAGISKSDGGFVLGEVGTEDPNDDPSVEWYSLDWRLPCDCGNETQSDSFQLNVYFYAEQVRNNPEPASDPWA